MRKFVSYIRVSTKKQGKSGLGLEGQREAVKNFVGNGEVIKEFKEIETGTNKRERPTLKKALRFAKMHGATLVIAKLDRLSRNVHFISGLMETKVDFVACDNPEATPLTIHILAAVAENEARQISERTKAALAAARKRGVKFGTANPHVLEKVMAAKGYKKANKASSAARRSLFDEHYEDIMKIAVKLRDQGESYPFIAEHLNEEGYRTRRGDEFTHSSIYAAMKRAGKIERVYAEQG